MPFIIEIQDREWDTANLINALKVPVQREYVAKLTVDNDRGQIVFDGDVQFRGLHGGLLHVTEWDDGDVTGVTHSFRPIDIRRVEMY